MKAKLSVLFMVRVDFSKMGIGFDPCGDRQTQVGLMSCQDCLHFVHKKYNGIKRYFSPRLEFMLSRCQDTPRPVYEKLEIKSSATSGRCFLLKVAAN